MTTVVRDIAAKDAATWRGLWDGYCQFYQSVVPPATTDHTWRRLLDPISPIAGRVAEADGRVVGFSHCVMHEGTWATNPIGYLEDLFVDPAVRGKGIGRLLLQDLVDRGKRQGWEYLYWHTQSFNATARKLYDTFTLADDFVKYRITLR